MSNNSLFRIGGISAILGILLMVGYVALPLFLGIGVLVTAVFYFALYRLFDAESPVLRLLGVVLAVGGGVLMLFTKPEPSVQYGIALLTALFLPALLFGFVAYQHGKAGLPRVLAIIGIAGGVFGVLNFVIVGVGGGDYTNPNNPALTPFIYATYLPSMLALLVWWIWGGIALFRKA